MKKRRCSVDVTAEAMVEGLSPQLLRLARRRMGPTDADDVVQETLAAVVMQAAEGRFRGDASLKTWAIAILFRRIAMESRRRSRAADGMATSLSDSRLNLAPLCAGDFTEHLSVWQAIEKLPEPQRAVFCLSLEGFRTREIAVRLGRSPGRTGALLAEAKRGLRNAIAVSGH